MSDWHRGKWGVCATAGSLSLLFALAWGCGPDISQPSPHDLTGRWVADQPIGPVSDIQVDIGQGTDGNLNGQWVGKSTATNTACLGNLGSSPTGKVSGSNTILQVHFSLSGVGDFSGQVIDPRTLQGSFVSCGHAYSIKFLLVATPP